VEEGRAAGMTVHKKMAQQRTTDPPRTLVWHVLGRRSLPLSGALFFILFTAMLAVALYVTIRSLRHRR
jgi:hypothetical protein